MSKRTHFTGLNLISERRTNSFVGWLISGGINRTGLDIITDNYGIRNTEYIAVTGSGTGIS